MLNDTTIIGLLIVASSFLCGIAAAVIFQNIVDQIRAMRADHFAKTRRAMLRLQAEADQCLCGDCIKCDMQAEAAYAAYHATQKPL